MDWHRWGPAILAYPAPWLFVLIMIGQALWGLGRWIWTRPYHRDKRRFEATRAAREAATREYRA